MRRLREFWQQHPDAQNALQAWYKHINQTQWRHFTDVRRDFPSVDQVKRLTAFNIGGNKYRLVARIEFEKQQVYIRQVMTHAEYNKEKWKDDPWFQ